MLQLTQSPFLQALGYTIINSLWQFALLWLIYVSIHFFLKLSSGQKYATGLMIQAAGFTWFAGTSAFYLQRFLRLEEIYFLQQKKFSFAIAENSASTVSRKIFTGILQAENLLPYLSVAYLVILLLLCVKWIRAYNTTQAIKINGLQKAEVKWRLFVRQLAGQLGIKREVKIFLSEMVETPMTIGFFKPLILIPIASLNNLTAEQMEAVILHELAHIKRYDYLFNLFLALIEITLFFNPFMHLISRHIKRERENCCDDWVLQYKYNPASYANALLQLATCQSSSFLAMKATDNKKALLSRIIRMIEKKEKSFFNYRYQLMALLVMLTVLSSLAVLSSKHNANSAAVAPSAGHFPNKPMNEIVKSPLYNPDFFVLPDAEKEIKGNRFTNEKIADDTYFDTSLVRKTAPATDYRTGKKNHFSKITNIEEELPFPPAPDAPQAPETFADAFNNTNQNSFITNDIDTNFQIFTELNKAENTETDEKEREIALAKEQLKQLAIHLFEEKKVAINQEAVIAEIKAALNQLKTVKIQLNSAKNNVADDKRRKAEQENLSGSLTEFRQSNTVNFQIATENMQLQLAKAEKQRKRMLQQATKASELARCYVNKIKIRNVIYTLPFREQPHSFSFEFSTTPKVKALAQPNTSNKVKTEKKVGKNYFPAETEGFSPEKTPPAVLEKLSQKGFSEGRKLVIIRI